VAEPVKQERWERFMGVQQRISEARLARQVGRTIEVIVDQVDDEGIVARSKMDAPEIDGSVFLDLAPGIAPGDIVPADIDEASEYDLYGTVAASAAAARPKPGQPKAAGPRRAAPKRRRAQ
jgi:ribosomal protein S12 methylthiotransferase